jgi:hypothetical protein
MTLARPGVTHVSRGVTLLRPGPTLWVAVTPGVTLLADVVTLLADAVTPGVTLLADVVTPGVTLQGLL